MKTVAIIVAGGSGARFGSKMPKQFLKLAGRPLLAHTIQRFEDTAEVDEIFVVVAEQFVEFTRENIVEMYCFGKVSRVIVGGSSRLESTRNALAELPASFDLVAIHDGARPLTAPSDISRVIAAASKAKAAVLVTPISDTVKRVKDEVIIETVDREQLFGASTPQVFERELLLQANENFAGDINATDDSLVMEQFGVQPRIVVAEHPNPKVTTLIDFDLAQLLLERESKTTKPVR